MNTVPAELPAFVKRVGLVGAANGFNHLRTLILIPVLTKSLPVAEYGAWSFITAIILIALPLVYIGLPDAMVRFLPAEKNRKLLREGVFGPIVFIFFNSMIVVAIIYSGAEFIANTFLQDAAFSNVIRFSCFLLVVQSLNEISIGAFRALQKIERYSLFIILQAISEVALVSIFIFEGYGLEGAIVALSISKSIMLGFAFLIIVRHIGLRFPGFTQIKPFLAFGLPLVPSIVFEWINIFSDRIVIGYYGGAAPVGIYSAAYSIGVLSGVTLYIIVFVLSPTINRYYDEGNLPEVQLYLSSAFKYFLMCAIPSLAGLWLLAGPLLKVLTVPEFVEQGIIVVPLVAAAMLFDGIRAIYGVAILLFKKTRIFSIAAVVAGTINIGMNIILVPFLGILGAAVATLFSYVLIGMIMYYNSKKYIHFTIDGKFVLKSMMASLVMMLTISALKPDCMIELGGIITLGAMIYFAVLLILKGFNRDEVQVFRKAIGTRALR